MLLLGASGTIGRATQGVRLIDIDAADRVVSMARLERDEDASADAAASAATGDDSVARAPESGEPGGDGTPE